jgi:hypothetical protein
MAVITPDIGQSGWGGVLNTALNYLDHFVDAPAAADSTGTAGQVAYDSSYFYVCVATDTWVRTALDTWS